MDKISEAAKKYATHSDWDCRCDAYTWTDQKEKKSFTAGALFYRDEVMRGEMERFVKWVALQEIFNTTDDKWWAYNKRKPFAESTSQLYDKYFEHLKQQQDATTGNKG